MYFNLEGLDTQWEKILKTEFEKPYFKLIEQKYEEALNQNKTIYPKKENLFKAFKLTKFQDVKVILLGQDPYHNENQAMGLSFSVPQGEKIPPSLLNIYKELSMSLKIKVPQSGDLIYWAKQGVLLLNSILSVEKNKPSSHKDWGWDIFSDNIIKTLSNEKENLIFLLWGNYAQKKAKLINPKKHHILLASHPSPLARKGFLGCNHFKIANEILKKTNQMPIDWDLNKDYSLFS